MSLSTFEFGELELQRYPQDGCPYAARHRHHCNHCGWTDGTQLPDPDTPRGSRQRSAKSGVPVPKWWRKPVGSPGVPAVDWSLWESRPTPEGPYALTRTYGVFRLWIRWYARPYWSVETLAGDPICCHSQYPLVDSREDAAIAAMAAADHFAAEFQKGE